MEKKQFYQIELWSDIHWSSLKGSFLDQKYIFSWWGTWYQGEGCILHVQQKEEDRKKVLFSLTPVALPASLCCCPIPSLSAQVFWSSFTQMVCLIQDILPAIGCTWTECCITNESTLALAILPSLLLGLALYSSAWPKSSPGWQDQHLQGHSKKPRQQILTSLCGVYVDVFQPCHQAKCRHSHDSRLASCQIFSLCFKTLEILS